MPKDGAARFDPNLTPTASVAGLRAAISAIPIWGHTRAAELAERFRVAAGRCRMRRRHPGAARDARLVARARGRVGRRRREARGGGRDRARPSRARAGACLRRVVERRERPRAPGRSPVGSRHVLRPRFGAADPADLRSGRVARRSRARSRRREPLRRLPRDTRRAGARRRRDPARRPRPLSLLRGARAPLRGTRLHGPRVRLLRTDRRCREARRRLRVHAARAADDTGGRAGRCGRMRRASPSSRVRGGLHGRVLLRRPQLVARRGVRARPQRRDRLLRPTWSGQRRLTRSDAARGRDDVSDPRLAGRRRSRDPRRGLARRSTTRSPPQVSTTRS